MNGERTAKSGLAASLVEVSETRIVCRRPLGLRIGMGIVALVLGAMCLALFGFFWPTPGAFAERLPADSVSQIASFLLVPLLGLFGPTALFLYFAGPADLIVDTDRRTYRFRRGFPLLAAWREGPLDDIADLRVGRLSERSSQLLLDWKNTEATPWTFGDGPVSSRRPVQMAVSQDTGMLRQEAQRLVSRLDIPLAGNAPALHEARRRTQTLLVLIPAVLFFLLSGLPPLLVNHALASEGQDVRGTVTGMRGGKGYSIRYTYLAAGKQFQGRASVPWPVYASLTLGGPVPVRYLPSYPHTSTVEGARSDDRADLLPLLVGVLLPLLVLIALRSKKSG